MEDYYVGIFVILILFFIWFTSPKSEGFSFYYKGAKYDISNLNIGDSTPLYYGTRHTPSDIIGVITFLSNNSARVTYGVPFFTQSPWKNYHLFDMPTNGSYLPPKTIDIINNRFSAFGLNDVQNVELKIKPNDPSKLPYLIVTINGKSFTHTF